MDYYESNDSFHNGTSPEVEDFYYIPVSAFLVFCSVATIVGALIDLLIIVTMTNFSVLHTKRNFIITNWAACDCFCLVTEPSKFHLVLAIFRVDMYNRVWHAFESVHYITLAYIMVFVAILFLDCIYKRVTLEQLKKVTPFIYTIFLILTISNCFVSMSVDVYLLIICNFTMLLTLVVGFIWKSVLYFKRRVQLKEMKTQVRYLMTGSYVCCWFMFMVSAVIIIWTRTYHLEGIMKLFLILGYGNCVAQLALLYMFDENFALCVAKVLKGDIRKNTNVDGGIERVGNNVGITVESIPN